MIKVQTEDFDIGAELDALCADKTQVGALSSFVGMVRDLSGDNTVSSMSLEHYPGMTERQLEKLEAEARARWDLIDVVIVHRYGTLEPGDRIILVATTAAHRQVSIDSCHFLIDWLKTKAPFWKLETTQQGDHWVDAEHSDTVAEERWIIPSRTLQDTD